MATTATIGSSRGVLAFADRPALAEVVEALLCISSGGFATRACSEAVAEPDRCDDVVRVGGVRHPEPPGPWVRARSWLPNLTGATGGGWRLDVERGVVEHDLAIGGRVLTSLRFASAATPGISVWTLPGAAPADIGGGHDEIVLDGDARTAVVAMRQHAADGSCTRIAAAGVGPDRRTASARASHAADLAVTTDGAALREAHESAWAEIWDGAHIGVEGSAADEQAIGFALFHLLSLDDGRDELAVGARGLTGDAYDGHVFWDADVFVLPVLAATRPAAAAAMLAYRAGRLDEARSRAAAEGRRGARFPWESAASGCDVTPRWATALDGTRVAVTTGDLDIHIASDIAWAVLHHARWTADPSLPDAAGRALIVETARYLADRIVLDGDARAHICDVTGPDEYHEGVDDNAFTNAMARWHLRAAAGFVDGEEAARFSLLAGSLVDGFDTRTRRHEQFAGFTDLDPLLIAEAATPPVAADVLLGRDLVRRSQVIKQADVVMLHHLIGHSLPEGSLEADLDFYLPRTAHGSSLSPAIHASVLARADRPDEALELLRMALQMDLADRTGTTADGLHLATMGGAWQAIVVGFLGLAVEDGPQLRVDPVLPADWHQLRVRLQVLGRRVEICAGHDEVTLTADASLTWIWPGAPEPVSADALRLVGRHHRWRQG